MNPKFNIGDKVLCRESMNLDDKNIVTKNKWYTIVYNQNDYQSQINAETFYTFSIIDDQNMTHMFFVYPHDENNHLLYRTYSKWFFTSKELRKKKLELLKLK